MATLQLTYRAMTSRTQAISLACFASLTLLGAEAFACRCTDFVRNPAKKAEIAFWGTPEEIEHKGAVDKVQFRIDKLFRGDDDKKVVQVWASRYEHDCGIRFEKGKSYVIYAQPFHPRGVATSLCWQSHAAAEEPTDEEFLNPDTEIRKPYDLETKVRVMAKKIVARCSARTRLNDAGWSMILSPGGDPVAAPQDQRLQRKEEEFRECVIEGYLADDETPRPDRPLRMEGYYQGSTDRLPSLVDQLDCGENCPTWEAQVRAALLTPLGGDDTSAVLAAARTTCWKDGVDAAQAQLADTRAPARAEAARRNAMLLACAASRGEYDKAAELSDAAPNEQYLAAVEWLKSKQPKDVQFPIGAGKPTFPAFWFEANKEKSTHGGLRVLRTSFLEHPMWAMHPVFLEAFAESIIADDEATDTMRDLAALAYHKAGRVLPEKAKNYEVLARDASGTPEAAALVKQLDEAYAKLAPPPAPEPEVAPAVGRDPVVAEVQTESGGVPANTMWYMLGGVVVLVLGAGAFQRFKK